LRMDAFRTFIFVMGAAAIIWFHMKGKLNHIVGGLLISLLVLIDVFQVAKRFINSDNFSRSRKTEFAMSKADARILNDKSESYRVLNLLNPFNDGLTSYYHKSIGGYHGAKMGRYQDLISSVLSDEHGAVIKSLQSGQSSFQNTPALNMLNTKYFKFGNEASTVIENSNPNGNAWFVETVKPVNNPDEEIKLVKSFDSKRVAVIDQSDFAISSTNYDSLASVKLTSYQPNHMVYESNSNQSGLVVFSEIYYPEGWVATIDDKEASIIRANYVLRALEIPAGQHKIEFRFRPTSYHVGNTVSWISGGILYLVLIAAVLVSFTQNNANLRFKKD